MTKRIKNKGLKTGFKISNFLKLLTAKIEYKVNPIDAYKVYLISISNNKQAKEERITAFEKINKSDNFLFLIINKNPTAGKKNKKIGKASIEKIA